MLAAEIGKHRGRPVRPVWAYTVRVELGLYFWNPFVTQFGRGTSSPAYKYKSHGRLRSFYPIESINLHFSYFSSNPSFSNLVLFFARLYGVQGRLGWPADSKTTLDFQAPTGSLPSLRFKVLRCFLRLTGLAGWRDRSDWSPGFIAGDLIIAIRVF